MRVIDLISSASYLLCVATVVWFMASSSYKVDLVFWWLIFAGTNWHIHSTNILDPLTENNYQLFMVERLILMGAKTFIKTNKEDDNNLSLTDDLKKNTKNWPILVFSTHCHMTVMTLFFCGMTVMSQYIHIVNQNLVASWENQRL